MVIPARKKLFRGFTLIELLIVIAILGILAAAVLVAVNPKKRQEQAKDANIKADVGSIATGLQAYFTSPGQGSYPLTLLKLEENKDLVKVPTPPAGAGAEYVYAVNPSATCDGTATAQCISASVSEPLFDKTATDAVWCWQSSTGKGQPVTAAVGCPAN